MKCPDYNELIFSMCIFSIIVYAALESMRPRSRWLKLAFINTKYVHSLCMRPQPRLVYTTPNPNPQPTYLEHNLTTATNIRGFSWVTTRPAGRVRRCLKCHESGRVGSGFFESHGSGRVGYLEPARPAGIDPTKKLTNSLVREFPATAILSF